MKQMICLSDAAWHGLPSRGLPSRTAQLAGRLKNYRILFVDPPEDGSRDGKGEGEQVNKQVTLLKAPPKGNLARRGGFWNTRYQRKLARFLSERLRDYGFDKPVLWLTDPASIALLDRFPHGPVVFDCQKVPIEGVSGPKGSDRKLRQTEALARAAQLVIAQSEGARKALSAWNPGTVLVPNGVDFEYFQRARDESLAFPNDLFTVKNPILGHVGTLGEHLELSFVEKAAAAHPEWSFVFIGEAPETEGVKRLRTLKNVHFLGVKPQKQLPMYLCRFDVCISLYRSSEMSRDISPMKLYEYLASGKPIVSTPQPAQTLDYADVVYIAGTSEEWTEACRKAVMERDAWKVRQRMEYAKASSWDARVVDLERAFNEQLALVTEQP